VNQPIVDAADDPLFHGGLLLGQLLDKLVAEHQRGTVAEFKTDPHARLSAAPAARQSASEPM
jgi:hypothetical protein